MAKKGRTPNQVEREEINAVFKDLDSESDRGAAIVGAAYLSECLGRLIAASFLIDDSTKVDELLKWPLRNFGSRIKTSYCMGLISEDEHHDLETIQQIRNHFAHEFRSLSFSDARITRECNKLRLWKPAPQWLKLASARSRFILTTSRLFNQLKIRTLMQKPERRVTPGEFEVIETVGFASEEHDNK